MQEIELKLLLDAAQEKRLRASPVLRALGLGRARTETLRSTYYDTADGDLRAAGIALRLRRIGARRIQTVKKKQGEICNGLASPLEFETPLEGEALDLTLIAHHDLREELIGLARKGLAPVADTTFRRTSRLLQAPTGGTVELAIDVGTVAASGREEAFIEAELELKDGHAADLYALAGELFQAGPVRFSEVSKSERARQLGVDAAPAAPALRKHRPVALAPEQTVEEAARAVLLEGLGHALPNLARTLEDDGPDGPHQLRVGLRRLRSAFSAFRPVLGREALAPWADQAREIAGIAGRLRDLDVLTGEMIPDVSAHVTGEPGFAALSEAVTARRDRVQAEVRAALAGPEVTGFGFAALGFIAARGWLDPLDLGQTRRLASPVTAFADTALARRWKGVARYGARIEALTIDERHEMRKELKKLRYVVDAFRSLYDAEAVAETTTLIKRLQTAFGALNDSAMAEMILTAPDAPGADNALAQRAVGRMIGHYTAEADRLWPEAVTGWRALAANGGFWGGKRG